MVGKFLPCSQPPGTGKTRTIVEAIKLLKLEFQVVHPVLLTAHTNVAVDNLADGCRKAGLKVVRTGPSARVRDSLLDCTLDAHVARHPWKGALDETKAVIQKLQRELLAIMNRQQRLSDSAQRQRLLAANSAEQKTPYAKKETGMDEEGEWELDEELRVAALADAADEHRPTRGPEAIPLIKKQISRSLAREYFLKQVITGEVLHGADVVCTTAIAAGSPSLKMIDFPIVFFDEGSMATEPISLIALMKGCRHLAIIGDHKQLPPVVSSTEARQRGLSLSLFERLINRGDVPSTMLNVQHRMHPSLSLFPNHAFYDAALCDGEDTHALAPLVSAFLPSGQSSESSENESTRHLSFVAHSGREKKMDNSLSNWAEARLVCKIIVDLLARNPELKGSDIGIVTPYIAQVMLLERLIKREGPLRTEAEDTLGAARAAQLADVETHTVDGFEGREKASIIFSTVRTNAQGFVGFLADRRRLNVALTRAQRALFVLGNLETLKKAQLGEMGAKAVEKPDLETIRRFAGWMESGGYVVRAEEVLRRLEEEESEAEE